MTHRMLSEAEGYELLKKNGIPVPEFLVVRSRSEAGAAADRLGYPLVMKVISPRIIHKSDAGGVVTGILSANDAEKAFDQSSPDGLSRRSFLRSSAVLASGLAALAASLAPLRHLNDFPSVDRSSRSITRS